MSVVDKQHLESLRYRVYLTVKCLHLAKNVNFNCKVLWKRRKLLSEIDQARAETKAVPHRDNKSIFNEELQLEFNIQRDTRSNLFLEKHTDLLPVIITEGGLKSGGVGRFDLAEALNKSPDAAVDKTVALSKCPDPSGCIDVSIRYECLGLAQSTEQKSEISICQTSMTGSRIDIKEKEAVEPQPKSTSSVKESVNLEKVIESLERRLLDGKSREQRLTAELQQQKDQMAALRKALDKKSQQLLDKCKELASLKAQTDMSVPQIKSTKEKDATIQKLQTQALEYEKQIAQLEARTPSTPTFPDHIFEADTEFNYSELKRVSTDNHFTAVGDTQLKERLQELQQEKLDLQTQLAISNNRLANMFNVAYEAGGAKLLDLLQSCIEQS